MRHRARINPRPAPPVTELPEPVRHGLSRDQVRWIRGTQSDVHVAAIAQKLNVDPAVILAIRLGNQTEAHHRGEDHRRAV